MSANDHSRRRPGRGWSYVYSALFAVYPIAAIWADNSVIGNPGIAWLLVLAVVVAAMSIRQVLRGLGFRHEAAGLGALVAVVAFYNWPDTVMILEPVVDRMTVSSSVREPGVGILALGLYLGAWWGLVRLQRWLAARDVSLSLALGVGSVIVLAIPLLRGTRDRLRVLPDLAERSLERGASVRIGEPADLPDIYWIVLDGYGRDDVLRSRFDLDNGEFLEFLRHREFSVLPRAWANYAFTSPAAAAFLSGSYLRQLDAPRRLQELALARQIDRAPLLELARDAGYEVRTVPAVPTSEVFPDIGHHDSGYGSLVSSGDALLLHPLVRAVIWGSVLDEPMVAPLAGAVRRLLDGGFERLRELGRTREESASPQFVYAHFLLPHMPFVFTATGDARDPKAASLRPMSNFSLRDQYREGYAGQVQFANARLEHVLSEILASSERPVAVVLTADHGPALGLVPNDATRSDLKERFAILAALRLPDCERPNPAREVGPINAARILASCYLDSTVETVTLRLFFSPLDDITAFELLRVGADEVPRLTN